MGPTGPGSEPVSPDRVRRCPIHLVEKGTSRLPSPQGSQTGKEAAGAYDLFLVGSRALAQARATSPAGSSLEQGGGNLHARPAGILESRFLSLETCSEASYRSFLCRTLMQLMHIKINGVYPLGGTRS
jgi:hypothetical protein